MIKFVEIYEKSAEYDPVLESNKESYGLREVFVNPSHIVYMKENEKLNAISKDELLAGLHKEVGYTQLMIMYPGHAYKNINVLGALEHIARICKDTK